MKLDPYLTPYKNNPKWIKNLNRRDIRRKYREKLNDIELGNGYEKHRQQKQK